MSAGFKEYLAQEDPKRPYTDQQLAQFLGLRREQVVQLRREAGIPDSRARLRPVLLQDMEALLRSEPGLSDRALTARLNENGYEISRFLVKELRETLPPVSGEATDIFSSMIGWNAGLKAQIHQAKAAVSYPPNGLNTLIIGPSGTGKTFLAENMYHYAVKQGFLAQNAPFVAFNCADYADNPQLLNSQLFGYVKGAFSGAGETRDGIVAKADGGILFLDEIHRLSGEGQEMLFYLLDKGAYRRLGDSGPARKVSVRLIAATTSSPESALLLTFRRRIPIVISMPALVDRPLAERFAVINGIFAGEQKKIDRRLIVEADTVRTLLQYDCPGNIGQLQSDIQVCCASAFLESLSHQDDVVYIRSELVEHLLSAGLVPRPLEIESRYCHQLTFPLQEDREPKGTPGLDTVYGQMRQTMEEESQTGEDPLKLQERILDQFRLTKQIRSSAGDGGQKELEAIRETVEAILRKTQGISVGAGLEEALALCFSGGFFGTWNTALPDLEEKYPAEYALAIEIAERYRSKRQGETVSQQTLRALTLCLFAFSARKKQNRIRVILMAHGKIGEAMAEVVNRILQDDNAVGFSMGWEESSEQVLERAIRLVQQVDEGKGCLLLVDMGSLASFTPEIALRTGVKVRCVARVDTLMALDAVHRAGFRDNCTLDELADALEIGRLHAGFSDAERRTGKPAAILTVCITGEGYAKRIESFLKSTIAECQEIHIVDVGLLNRDAMLSRLEELRRRYDVVAAVGTMNPELPGIPFLSMEYVFSSQGSMALANLLQDHHRKPDRLGELLDPQLILFDADFEDKNDVIDHMYTLLLEKGRVKPEFLLSVYKRENLGATCLPEGIAIPHGEPAFVTKPAICLAKLRHSVEWADHTAADFVFLFALTEDCQIYVQRFYEFITDKSNINLLFSAKSGTELYSLLS